MKSQEKFTKLLNTDIIAVEVPRDARELEIIKTELQTILRYFTGNIEWKGISLPKSDFELLGEATEDEISFDVELHIKKMYFDVEGRKIAYFKDYNPLKKLLHDIYCFTDKNESFRNLLQASGLNWVNPMGGKYCNLNKRGWSSKQWQEAESKLIKGKLIFLKIVK